MFLRSCILSILHLTTVVGHGMMLDPPGRSSMWRAGFPTPHNYDDNGLNCGGRANHWFKNGGKCGPCGDPWQGPRENEAGGKYATGLIVRKYMRNKGIDVKIKLTANHGGWFEFRLCPNNDPKTPVTQKCLDKRLLRIRKTKGTRRFVIQKGEWQTTYVLRVKLPKRVTCTQCVLQWKYSAGESLCAEYGNTCMSWRSENCAGQHGSNSKTPEEFYNCADIAIA